jgi:hypothetical protein
MEAYLHLIVPGARLEDNGSIHTTLVIGETFTIMIHMLTPSPSIPLPSPVHCNDSLCCTLASTTSGPATSITLAMVDNHGDTAWWSCLPGYIQCSMKITPTLSCNDSKGLINNTSASTPTPITTILNVTWHDKPIVNSGVSITCIANQDQTDDWLRHGWANTGDLCHRYAGAPKYHQIYPIRLKRYPSSWIIWSSVIAAAAHVSPMREGKSGDNDNSSLSCVNVTQVDGRMRLLIQLPNVDGSDDKVLRRLQNLLHHPCTHMMRLCAWWYTNDVSSSPAAIGRTCLVYDHTRALTLAETLRERTMYTDATNMASSTTTTPTSTSAVIATTNMGGPHRLPLRWAWQLCSVLYTLQASSPSSSTISDGKSVETKTTPSSSLSPSSSVVRDSSMGHGYMSSRNIYVCDSNGSVTPYSINGICCNGVKLSMPWLPHRVLPSTRTQILDATTGQDAITSVTCQATLTIDANHELWSLPPAFAEAAPERLIRLTLSSRLSTSEIPSSSSSQRDDNHVVVSPLAEPTIASDMWSIGCILLDMVMNNDPLKHNDTSLCYASHYTPAHIDGMINECAYKRKASDGVTSLLRGLLARDPQTRLTPERAMQMIATLIPEIFTSETAIQAAIPCRALECQKRYDMMASRKFDLARM